MDRGTLDWPSVEKLSPLQAESPRNRTKNSVPRVVCAMFAPLSASRSDKTNPEVRPSPGDIVETKGMPKHKCLQAGNLMKSIRRLSGVPRNHTGVGSSHGGGAEPPMGNKASEPNETRAQSCEGGGLRGLLGKVFGKNSSPLLGNSR